MTLRKNKYGVWQFDEVVGGTRYQRSLKTKDKSVAVEAARRFRARLGQVPKSGIVTVFHLYDLYTADAESYKKPHSQETEQSILKPFVKKYGERMIHTLTRLECSEYIQGLLRGRTESTVNGHLRVLKAMFNQAVDWELLEVNPFSKVKRFTTDEKIPRSLSPKEYQRLYQAMQRAYPELSDILTVLLLTGMRRGECLELMTWESVDFERRIITLIGTKGRRNKKRKVRLIPMSPTVYRILLSRKNQPFPFMSQGNRVLGDYFHTRFRLVADKAGLTGVTIHDLRRTYATWLAEAGLSELGLMRAAGWSDPSVASDYYVGRMLGEIQQKLLAVEQKILQN